MDIGKAIDREELSAQMSSIWQEVFGDDKEYVDQYLSHYDNCDNRIVRIVAGRVAAFLHYHQYEFGSERASYIFGVVTLPEHRGKGMARGMIKDALTSMWERNDTLAMLIAGEESLRAWYLTMGFAPVSDNVVKVAGSDGLPMDNDCEELNMPLYRIVNVSHYLSQYAASNPCVNARVKVVDSMLPHNNACYAICGGNAREVVDETGSEIAGPAELIWRYPLDIYPHEVIIPRLV